VRVRCTAECSFFVIRQRTNQENGLRGLIPLRTPQREKVVTLLLHSSFREVLHLQLLRARLKESRTHGSCSDFAFAKDDNFCLVPCDRRNLKQNGKAKAFAKPTHLGRALMRPRWRRLAEQKAPPAMKGRRDAGEAPEGTAGLTFFGTFFVQRQRKYIKAEQRTREAV